MKRIAHFLLAGILLAGCTESQDELRKRTVELCQYIPDHELKAGSERFMTKDFYAVLDTMFNYLPEHETMDHEWLHYFVTSNGGTIVDYEVTNVRLLDKKHAKATIRVRLICEDTSFDENSDIEEHKLSMEKEDGQWLMADFDGHKNDCIRHIALNRKEQVLRQAISDYLEKEVGSHYLQGEHCIPILMMVSEEETDNGSCDVFCDCWVEWYNVAGDTLKTVSGGNHSGRMTLVYSGGLPVITSFEQTTSGAGNAASAERIFGQHFDVYQNIHSNGKVREAVRREHLNDYIRKHQLNIRYYQDYGLKAIEL